MTKEQLLAVEQNLSIKQQEIIQMRQDIEAHKEYIDNQTASELANRLSDLYKDYSVLKSQIAILKQNEEVYEQLQSNQQIPKVVQNTQKTSNQTPQYTQQPQPKQPLPPAPIKQRPQVRPKPTKPKKDLEKTLGKNVMGVMASILIFVSLIMFAIVALPNMTDTIKMIAMFIISGGITGLGLMLMKKDSANGFNASIAGCGIGAVFISLITTRMYFNAINDYFLYITLLIWAAAVAYFSKDKHKVFVVIAEVGISVASFIGIAGLLVDNSSIALKANMLIAFALLSEIAIFYFNSTEEMSNDIFMHVPHALRTFVLSIFFVTLSNSDNISAVPVMMIIFIIVGLYLLNKSEGHMGKSFLITSYVLPIFLVYNNYATIVCKQNLTLEPYVILIGLAIIIHSFAYIYKDYKAPTICAHIALIACTFYFIDEVAYHTSFSSLAILLPAIIVLLPITAFSKILKKEYWKWLSAALPLVLLIAWGEIGGLSNFNHILGFAIAFIYTIANFSLLTDDKDDILRIVLYVGGLWLLSTHLGDIFYNWETENNTISAIFYNVYAAAAYIPMVITYLWVDKTRCVTRQKDITTLQNIIMGILIFAGSILLNEGPDAWRYDYGTKAYIAAQNTFNVVSWLIGLSLIALNALRTYDMLKRGKGYGIGVSISYVVSLFAIITRISDINYIVSITMLFLAIGLIVMGFKINVAGNVGNKEMRLFGLVLSMIVTIKLLMLDIEHNNLLETSGFLLLAGALCFAISFAYNRLDKVMIRDTAEINETIPANDSLQNNDSQEIN